MYIGWRGFISTTEHFEMWLVQVKKISISGSKSNIFYEQWKYSKTSIFRLWTESMFHLCSRSLEMIDTVLTLWTMTVRLCLVIQSCPTLCDHLDCSPPGTSVHGILQARILEWVTMTSPRDRPNPGIEPTSPASLALQAGFHCQVTREASYSIYRYYKILTILPMLYNIS